jgi:hypothetical protein
LPRGKAVDPDQVRQENAKAPKVLSKTNKFWRFQHQGRPRVKSDKSLVHPDMPPGIIEHKQILANCVPDERYKTVKVEAIV